MPFQKKNKKRSNRLIVGEDKLMEHPLPPAACLLLVCHQLVGHPAEQELEQAAEEYKPLCVKELMDSFLVQRTITSTMKQPSNSANEKGSGSSGRNRFSTGSTLPFGD